jgi:hypothetical protein
MSTEILFCYVILEPTKHLPGFYCNYKHSGPFPEERYNFDKNLTFLIRYTEHIRNVTSIDWVHLFPILWRRVGNGWVQLFRFLECPTKQHRRSNWCWRRAAPILGWLPGLMVAIRVEPRITLKTFTENRGRKGSVPASCSGSNPAWRLGMLPEVLHGFLSSLEASARIAS